jgi:hypothetical protein
MYISCLLVFVVTQFLLRKDKFDGDNYNKILVRGRKNFSCRLITPLFFLGPVVLFVIMIVVRAKINQQ